MRRFRGLSAGLLAVCLSIFLIAGCSPASESEALESEEETEESEPQTSQNGNGESNDDCDEVRRELASVRSEYNELNLDYNKLNTEYGELEAEHGVLNTQYDKLQEKYNALDIKYNAVIQATVELGKEDVEQAVFDLINQDREINGLKKLEWSVRLYRNAEQHSDYLAGRGVLELADRTYWQDVACAAGYATVEQLAIGMLRVWQEATSYEGSFLNDYAKFGAVAVTRTGDVYYITYFSHMEK